jgi:hypothetical protein
VRKAAIPPEAAREHEAARKHENEFTRKNVEAVAIIPCDHIFALSIRHRFCPQVTGRFLDKFTMCDHNFSKDNRGRASLFGIDEKETQHGP